MSLAPGTRLGVYELVSQIGAGGMGEVYKAKDPKLDRLVAIKVLRPHLAQDASFLARFEQEAKAVAALSHPNVLGIFDFGQEFGQTYAVMELLEGESLRERLREGPLAAKKAVEIAAQAALGLAAAHDKGIVHRDIKPENIFLCRDGRVKVLDFGLVKQLSPEPRSGSHEDESPTAAFSYGEGSLTGRDVVMGTTGYMAPEQIRGEPVDHRVDIFALGTVLYELLSGQRAFKRDSAIETLNAILKEEPKDLMAIRAELPPALDQLVVRCLEKRPENRFQSMKDLAFALGSFSAGSSVGRRVPLSLPRPLRSAILLPAAGIAATLLLGALAWSLGWPPFRATAAPTFTRLTYSSGLVESAFFTADGRSVYFTARLQGGRPEVFLVTPESPDPKPVGIKDAILLGVSPDSELAVLRRPERSLTSVQRGVLAKFPGGGGPGRDLQEDVSDAAWDGQNLSLLNLDRDLNLRLEYPVGRTLWAVPAMTHPAKLLRCSRQAQVVALVEGISGARTEIASYDRAGRRKVLHTKNDDGNGSTITGMAWHPSGELWFSELQGDQTAVQALSKGGRIRTAWRGGGAHQLMDISAQGRMLLAAHHVRRSVLVQRAGEVGARDLSIQGSTQGLGITADGKAVLLLESPVLDGGTAHDATYFRRVDGSPALRLGRGQGRALSADGAWANLFNSDSNAAHLDDHFAAAFRAIGLDPATALDPQNSQSCLFFVPVSGGRPWAMRLPARIQSADLGYPVPGTDQVIFYGTEKGRPGRIFVVDRKGGALRPLTAEGVDYVYAGLSPVSPDGRSLLVAKDTEHWFRVGLDGGEPVPFVDIQPGERLIGWSGDGKGVQLRSAAEELPVKVYLQDAATGKRRQLASFMPPDLSGHVQTRSVYASQAGDVLAYTVERKLSDLFLVGGMK